MLLSVITPDNQAGMAKMLEKELSGIDAEIIINNWDDGLKEAKGDFVCLLEQNSAINADGIRSSLNTFLEKPAYRKLAMVSPMFDLPSYGIKKQAWLSYHEGLTVNTGDRSGVHATQIGMILGAVIRTSSLKKAGISLNNNPLLCSNMISLFFWENGLRIHLNSQALYQGEEDITYIVKRPFPLPLIPSEKVQKIWQQEMIL